MRFFIVEIKARYTRHQWLQEYLEKRNARFIGVDRQRDTYFRVPNGRLKLREGDIENSLIWYDRSNQSAPKVSDGKLVKTDAGEELRELLLAGLGELITVEKERRIYFIDHIKIHLDQVAGLGTFVEIESIDPDGNRSEEVLRAEVHQLMEEFQISKDQLIDRSYSDLLLEKNI